MGQTRPYAERPATDGAEGTPSPDRPLAPQPSYRALLGMLTYALPLLLAIVSAGVGLALRLGGEPADPAVLAFVWIVAVAFIALPRSVAVLELAAAAAACAWGLSVHDDGLALAVGTVGTAAGVGVLVLDGRGRVDALRARLTDASRTDSLTGLLNRRALEEQLDLELERSRRAGRPLAVVVADMDGFRELNERHGHDAGDRALRLVARDMQKWKRRVDLAARIGGEEFALLLPETDERGAYLVAERLRRAAHRTFGEEGPRATVSFGVVGFPEHGDSAKELLRTAARALQAAKEMGGDRAVIYSAEIARMLGDGASSERGEMHLATVVALAEALDIRDSGSAQHSQAVGRFAELTARELGLGRAHAERVRLAGVLHDVGKVGISDSVLTKPGPLDEDEWRQVRTHPEIAARLLAGAEFDDIRAWVESHHERPDGGGYPRGLSGDEIPIEASILAVADAYEAMTADRVYRPALGEEAARAELAAGAGTQFDARVVDAFMRALERAPGTAERAPSRP